MVTSMCVLMHFGCDFGQNFSRLGLLWNRRHLHIHNTVSGLRIVMHVNSKRFIHTLPTEMFFNVELLANYIEGIPLLFLFSSFIVDIQNQNGKRSLMDS